MAGKSVQFRDMARIVAYRTGPARATRRDMWGPNGHLAHYRPFGRLNGDNGLWAHLGAPVSYGRLPDPARTELDIATKAGRIAYVVYSYATPIAWVQSAGTITIPAEWYSMTTTRHQNLVKAWLGHSVRHVSNLPWAE